VPSAGSLLKQTNTIQHANPSTDRPHSHNQNIKMLKIPEYTKLTSRNPPYCDTKAVDSEPFPVQAVSCLCFVCSTFTNICLNVCDPEGYRSAGARELCRDGQCKALGILLCILMKTEGDPYLDWRAGIVPLF